MTHTPIRMCVACRTRRPQRDLVRIARTSHGVEVDPDARLPGRGAYVCPDPRCVQRAAKKGARPVRRALRDADGREVEAALERVADLVGSSPETADAMSTETAVDSRGDSTDGIGRERERPQHFDRDKRQVTST